MTLFAEKQVFNLLGLEAIKPSPLHTSQDCVICTNPLAMQPSPAEANKPQSMFHTAVRITACGHIVGKECLDVWLDTSHMCPICNRELFDAKGDAITKQDINRVVQSLSRYYDIYKVRASISRVTRRVGKKYIPRTQVRGGEIRDEQMVEEEDDFRYSGDDVWGSDGDMEFDGEEEDDEYMEMDEDHEDEAEEMEDLDDAEGQEEKEKNLSDSEE